MEKRSKSADYKIATLTAQKAFSYLREALIDAMYEEGIMTSSDSKGYVDHHELLLEQTVDMLTYLNSVDLKRRKDYREVKH